MIKIILIRLDFNNTKYKEHQMMFRLYQRLLQLNLKPSTTIFDIMSRILDKDKMKNLIDAYLGDAVYELYVRKYLIDKGISNVHDLQTKSIEYVSAVSQRRILEELIKKEFLTKEEIEIVNRGRNADSHKSKTTDVITYHKATGFECLIGFLYQNNKERLEEVMEEVLCV